MEAPRYGAPDCDRTEGREGKVPPQPYYARVGEVDGRSTVCDRGGDNRGASGAAASSYVHGGASSSSNVPALSAPRAMNLADRRASLELRCLGVAVGRTNMPSGLVISKVNAAGSSRQEIAVKDISRGAVDLQYRNLEEVSGGCDVASKEKTASHPMPPPIMGPPSSPMRSPPSRPVGSHNGEGLLHPGNPHPSSLPPHVAALGDPSNARARVGMSPPSGGQISIGDGVIISRAAVDTLRPHSGSGGHEMSSPGRRNGDVAIERQARNHSTPPRPVSEAMSSPQRAAQRSPAQVESGILSRMLGHGILTNGEITLTPRSRPAPREEMAPRPQGVKRGAEEMPGAHVPCEKKQAVVEPANMMERAGVPNEMRARGLSIEMRAPKSTDATPSPARNGNGFRMKEIASGRDEVTIEPVMDPNRRAYELQREQYLSPERRLTESFASRYPLLREGLSKPCLRRRGRPPKMALQSAGRGRQYMGEVMPDYTVYHTAQAQLSEGRNVPEGTMVSPLGSQQPRKSMSIDEVLSYYGSMQERKAMGADAEVNRPQQRGEGSVQSNPEASMAGIQNSSLAQIESMVQSQIPSTAGYYPTGVPQYPYLPNPAAAMPPMPGYAAQMVPYHPGANMLVPGMGYYSSGMRYRGRGRPRGRSRGRGRPRGSGGFYYHHGTERDLLPRPDYMPRHAEDVEEIVVEVDFKPEWEDEREAEAAREDSLTEAQKLVPNWISVVPAKMSAGRSQPDNLKGTSRPSSSVSHTPELTIQENRGPTASVSQRPVVVPEEVEICPSVEDVLGQTKANIQNETSEVVAEEAEEENSLEEKQAMVLPQSARAPDRPEEPVESLVDEHAKSESEEIQALEPAEKADAVQTAEGAKEAGDDVLVAVENKTVPDGEIEPAKLMEGPSEKTVVCEGDAAADLAIEEKQEVTTQVGAVIERRRSARERRERNSQLACSLASIKSLPKDVTVVRSRAGDSSKAHRPAAFPDSVATQLGPSIEIRRVRGSQRAVARSSSKDSVAEVSVTDLKAVVEKEEVEEAELLARIPALSKILSMGSSMKPATSSEQSEMEGASVGGGGADGLVAEVKVEPGESDVEPVFGGTDEDDEPEDDHDETYRPAGYRGTGRRRRGRGRRASATRVDSAPQQPRQRRVGRTKRTRVKVKVEEEERPGDWDVFVCDLCGRSFSKRFRLAHHIRAYHPMPTADGDGSARRVFPCQQCNKSFTRKANLKKHLRIHTGEKPFVCEECGRAFTFSKNLAQHRRVHGVERPFVCEVCGHAFRFSKNLSQHRGVHAHLKPHVCSVCGRGFSRSTHLAQHKRLHSGEKPFRCSVCGKRFAQRGHAALHTRIHTGERPYACPVCSRAFSLRAHLVRHVALHQRDGEMGPGRPPPLPRRDRRGRDGVEVVGADEEEGEGAVVGTEQAADRGMQEEMEYEGAVEEEYYGEEEEEYVEELGAEEGPFEGTLGEEEAYDEHYEGGYEETMEEETAEEGQLEDVMDVRAAPADGSTEAVALVQQDQDVNTAL
ncbi:uncharacterized protein LOC124172799 [Ischnura elegans]|uniref:uncharacterized protein LOC124172799 n=1 Tax=Ischnura elegans TaxID=197161 RepID=UPI001ED898B2|nr:uncharacterized protein LOC124172799 [Ischnura elegans]